jgi:hypothetical protein
MLAQHLDEPALGKIAVHQKIELLHHALAFERGGGQRIDRIERQGHGQAHRVRAITLFELPVRRPVGIAAQMSDEPVLAQIVRSPRHAVLRQVFRRGAGEKP